jgi:starvation-inducible outer membrane lipoprotein
MTDGCVDIAAFEAKRAAVDLLAATCIAEGEYGAFAARFGGVSVEIRWHAVGGESAEMRVTNRLAREAGPLVGASDRGRLVAQTRFEHVASATGTCWD